MKELLDVIKALWKGLVEAFKQGVQAFKEEVKKIKEDIEDK